MYAYIVSVKYTNETNYVNEVYLNIIYYNRI